MTLEDFTEFSADEDESAASRQSTDPKKSDGDVDESPDPNASGASDGPEMDDGSEAGDGAGAIDASESTDGAGAFERYAAEATGEDAGLGVISVSQGLRVAEEADETTLRAFVTTGNRESVRIGKYLIVPYPDGERLFCRITGLEYAQEFRSDDATEIHARRQMRRDEFSERDYKFVAELEPMSIVYGNDGNEKRRMTDRVPKPGAVIEEASDASEIKTGLKIPEEGVFLGHLAVGGETVETAARPPTVDYRLNDDYADGDPLVFRHALVAGGTGSGKTHASKNVLRQYLEDERRYEMDDGRESRMAVVQFDPQDEYAQMHDDNPEMNEAFERRLDREEIAHGGHEDTIALVPTTPTATYPGEGHRAERVEFTIPFSLVRDRPWLVAGASLNENQYSGLSTLIRRFFRDYGDSGTYEQFVSYLEDPALKEELHESGRIHEATFDAVKRRVYGVPGGVFDGDARPITDLDHTLVRPGGLTVIPTYHLPTSRQKEMFVLAVSALLIDDKLSNDPESDRIKETPLLIGMDEAHNFLADADNVQARKVIQKFTEAAKQGRKERLGLFLITQDPQDVAESVFKQINTKIVLNLGDEDAISSVNIPTNLAGKVPYMEKGQMVVYSPDNSEPVELTGLPRCLTRHGS
ncbi:ATP-binding protein [Halopenitus sp. H-Gu1]|uniref:ATP-binding protein n=1 Tax=Halopenitus sp. H-Gu1 TaxID=3242697 RepID=UPI00359EAC97